MSSHPVVDMTLLTLRVGAVATALILPFAVALGYLLARTQLSRPRPRPGPCRAPHGPYPPSRLGSGLLLLLSRLGSLGSSIVFSWLAAVLAAAVVGFPLLTRSLRAELRGDRIPATRTYRAASAWAGIATFFRVSLPLARRGVLYGTLLELHPRDGRVRSDGALVAGILPGSYRDPCTRDLVACPAR